MALSIISPDYLTRGKMDCGDIDVLITRPTDDNKTHAGKIYFSSTQ